MPGNTFGHMFRVTTWGESHGPAVGVAVDGCPPGIPLDETVIQAMLDRRRPGGSVASTRRKEPDRAVILSGIFDGVTTGTPIAILVENKDVDSKAYEPFADTFRPGHGDITYTAKYGVRDWRGGGRASARETVGRVAAGAVAKAVLKKAHISITAYTIELGGIGIDAVDLTQIHQNSFLCPDLSAVEKMEARIRDIRKKGDSVGGIVEIAAQGVPPGLGEPVFDKLDADLAKAVMSIGAVKGVEIGAGFEAARLKGSENNDPIMPSGFGSNRAGGILGGISNGDELVLRAAVKPIPSISKEQDTIDREGRAAKLKFTGRFDVSALPRIIPVLEAMVKFVLADHYLRSKAMGQIFQKEEKRC